VICRSISFAWFILLALFYWVGWFARFSWHLIFLGLVCWFSPFTSMLGLIGLLGMLGVISLFDMLACKFTRFACLFGTFLLVCLLL
jgi:hypothetical protein